MTLNHGPFELSVACEIASEVEAPCAAPFDFGPVRRLGANGRELSLSFVADHGLVSAPLVSRIRNPACLRNSLWWRGTCGAAKA
jgi:hypothetical protein